MLIGIMLFLFTELQIVGVWPLYVDLDKTVMEMKPQKRSRHPGILRESLDNYGLDYFLSLRARTVIKLRVEMTSMFLVTKAHGSKGKERNKYEKAY